MTRCERRRRTEKKLKQRACLVSYLGVQQGTLYERYRQKISESSGYMRDGNVTHFVAVRKYRKYHNRRLKHKCMEERYVGS